MSVVMPGRSTGLTAASRDRPFGPKSGEDSSAIASINKANSWFGSQTDVTRNKIKCTSDSAMHIMELHTERRMRPV